MSQQYLCELSNQSAPVSTQEFLAAAVVHWDDTPRSGRYIQAALAGDVGLDVLISAYRYYFYKSDAAMALKMAIAVCDRVLKVEQWPSDWASLKPILQAQLEEPNARLYINAYAATSLLQARLGHLDVAQTIAEQVQQLQAKEFGADVLLGILNSPPDEED